MSASNGMKGYLMDWRSTMTLVPKNLTQNCKDPGKTFRGPHARVENGLNRNCVDSDTARNLSACAKPGPTNDTSSRIARIKKLQLRTRTRVGRQTNGGTQRGAHSTVENGSNYLETMVKLYQVKLPDVVVTLVMLFISKMYLIEFPLINLPLMEIIKFSVVYLYND